MNFDGNEAGAGGAPGAEPRFFYDSTRCFSQMAARVRSQRTGRQRFCATATGAGGSSPSRPTRNTTPLLINYDDDDDINDPTVRIQGLNYLRPGITRGNGLETDDSPRCRELRGQ
jgi:hypothetical protein